MFKIAILSPFTPSDGGMPQLAKSLADNFEKDGHKVYRLSLGSGKAGILSFSYLYIHFFVIIPQYDIIHIISASGKSLWLKDLPAIILARLFRKRVIQNFVGGMAIEHFSQWPWYKRLSFRLASTVVVPTDILKDKIKNNEIRINISVIPHVVNVEKFQMFKKEENNESPILLAAKGLVSYAGFDLIIEIFIKVKKKIHNAQLWIAGSGPSEKDLKLRVHNMKIDGVTFLGNVHHDNMPALMRKSTVFVHGSRYESFGIVLVEAMASGLPVVAFNIGGIPEVVDDNITGYLVDYGDIDTFSEKIIKLVENQEKKQEFSTKAIKRSELFIWKNLKEEWYDIYHKA